MKNLLPFSLLFSIHSFTFSQDDEFVTDIAEIQEVVVKSSSTQTSLDLYSINILDYRVYGRDILTLKKVKRDYYIGIEYSEKEAEKYKLDIKYPRSIFVDCMNNVFVLNDDYAYQFVITDKIEIISVLKLDVFKANVKSCVANFDNSLLVQTYTNFNKGYQLEIYKKDTNEIKIVFQEVDEVALSNFLDIIQPDRRITKNSQMRLAKTNRLGQSPIINNGRANSFKNNQYFRTSFNAGGYYIPTDQQGNYTSSRYNSFNNKGFSLFTSSLKYTGSVNAFKDDFYQNLAYNNRNMFNGMVLRNLYNDKIEVETFKKGDGYVVVDVFNAKVSVFSKEGELIQISPLKFENKIIEMKQDPLTEEIYFTSKTENLFKFHHLDTKTGTTKYVGGFKNIMLAKTIKIFNGWIYYRVMKNDYYKLYRTRLRS